MYVIQYYGSGNFRLEYCSNYGRVTIGYTVLSDVIDLLKSGNIYMDAKFLSKPRMYDGSHYLYLLQLHSLWNFRRGSRYVTPALASIYELCTFARCLELAWKTY